MRRPAESVSLEKEASSRSPETDGPHAAPAPSQEVFDPLVETLVGNAPTDSADSAPGSLSVQPLKAPVLQRAQRLYGNRASQQIVMRALQQTSAAPAPPEFDDIPTTGGEPLDAATRRPLEAHFGADLEHVRVHTNSEAAKSATSLDALAYTSGRDIYFAAGMYSPASSSGQRLLAHEVAHVIQQISGKEPTVATKSARGVKIGAPGDSLDSEAEQAAEQFTIGPLTDEEQRKKRESSSAVQRFIQRQPQPQPFVPAPAGPVSVPPPRVPGGAEDVRSRAMKIGEQWGDLLGMYDVALETLQTKWAGVSAWDRMTPKDKAEWSNNVQDAFAKLPVLPRVDKPELAAAQEEGFKAGMESGYSMAKFRAFLVKLGTEIAIALFTGLAARGVRLPGLIAQILQQAERKALIGELAAAGVKVTEEEVVQIARSASGRIVFLEQGTAESGLQHIMLRHGDDFARVGVSGESRVTGLIMDALKSQTPVRTLAGGGQVFKVVINGVERGLQIVVGSNGYVVTAYPVSL
jgi:hypothetical protein